MKSEYDLSKMKSRKNPYASKLKKPVTIRLSEDVLDFFKGMSEESALTITAHMSQGKVIALDQDLAIEAASLGVRQKLPLADSIIYATTLKFDATLWTQDADFKGLSNVNYFTKSRST